MVEVTTLVDFTVHHMKSALYEDWTDGRTVLRKCNRKRAVEICDLRSLLGDPNKLWMSIRPYIRCTGLPHAEIKQIALDIPFLFDYDFSSSLWFLFLFSFSSFTHD